MLELTTDGSDGSVGFAFDNLYAFCNDVGTLYSTSLDNNLVAIGALLGRFDTNYIRLNNAYPENIIHVSMWDASPNADFDIYAMCDQRPTPTNYLTKGFLGGSNEYMMLRGSDCPSGDWHVAVNSYWGTGTYKLMWNYGGDGTLPLDACPAFYPTDQEMAIFADTLREFQRREFGTFQGALPHKNIRLYRPIPPYGLCPATTKIQFHNNCTRSYTNNQVVHMCLDCWPMSDAVCMVHEFGHVMTLQDEYQDVGDTSQSLCGHTLMASNKPWLNDLCVSTDHPYDGQIFPGLGSYSGWQWLENYYYVWPEQVPRNITPDGYDYVGHPLGNEFNVTVY